MLYLFQRKNYKDFNNPIYSLIGNVLALVFGHFPFAHFFLPRKLGVSTSKLPKQIIWVEQVFHALSFEYRVWGCSVQADEFFSKQLFCETTTCSTHTCGHSLIIRDVQLKSIYIKYICCQLCDTVANHGSVYRPCLNYQKQEWVLN